MESPKGKVTCPDTQPSGGALGSLASLTRCTPGFLLRLLDSVLQTAQFQEGLARSVQAAERRRQGVGKAGGRSSCISENQEACPVLLGKPPQQGEGEASRLGWKEGSGGQC